MHGGDGSYQGNWGVLNCDNMEMALGGACKSGTSSMTLGEKWGLETETASF